VAFLYPTQQQQQQQQAAAPPGGVGSLAYFMAKPQVESYDEEAEGCYEAAAAEAAAEAAAAAESARLTSALAAHAPGRAARRARRAVLRSAPGDLEAMVPWVADADAAAAADAAKRAAARVPAARYPHLHAFLAARTGSLGIVDSVLEALQLERGLQARAAQAWQYTWDEDVHGQAGGVLGSM
jgi:hypothetical protein